LIALWKIRWGRKYEKNVSLFKKFLYSYFYILALPLLACFLFYIIISINLSRQMEKRYTNEIEKAAIELKEKFISIDSYLSQISANPTLNSYINERVKVKIPDIQRFLNIYPSIDNWVYNVFLYTPDDDSIISKNTKIGVKSAYGDMISCGDYTYEKFKSEILLRREYKKLRSEDEFKFISEKGNYIMYINSLPIEDNIVRGQLIIAINKSSISEMFAAKVDVPLNISLATKDGSMIYTQNSFKAKKNDLTFETEFNNLVLSVRAARQSLSDDSIGFKIGLLCILLLLMAISAWIAYKSTERNISPIDKLLNSLSRDKGRQITMENLGELFDEIMEKEKRLSNEFSANREILMRNVLELLYKGEIESESEFNEKLRYMQIEFKGDKYVTVAIEIVTEENATYRQLSAIRLILNHIIEEKLRFITMNINDSTEVYVFAFKEKNIEINLMELEVVLTDAARRLEERANIGFKIAVSNFYNTLTQAVEAIEKTRNTLVNGVYTYMGNITWCSSPEGVKKEPYFFPLKLKQKLKMAFLSGEFDIVREGFSVIYEQNSRKSVVHSDEIEGLIFELKILIKSVLAEGNISEKGKEEAKKILKSIRNDSIQKSNFEKFNEVIKVIEQNAKSWEEPQGGLEQEMIKYINENYSDPDLCRQKIADHFNITPQYVSRWFKANIGENFLDYLEKVRIAAACKLLSEEKSVEQVAKEVGYLSVVSFRRVFKKNMGITPTQFIEDQKMLYQ